MTLGGSALSIGSSLVFLVVVFRPLEVALPAKAKQAFFRPGWVTDLCFFLGQYTLWTGLVSSILIALNQWIGSALNFDLHPWIASQPFWLQLIEVVLLSDLLIYWGHRLQHRVQFLWRFHSVHHSAEHLDWLAAHREHPLDTLYTVGLINLPAFLFGFPLETLVGLIAFRGIWAIYIHSNVRLPIGPARVLLGSPELHHWHHARTRDAGNYSNLSPIMDVMFGTYRCPDREPDGFGVLGYGPRSYLRHLIDPLISARRTGRQSGF
jgi:sterol desaturase/sphingolipid hydroxylase (fatty acid hydroxylase superfamily)